MTLSPSPATSRAAARSPAAIPWRLGFADVAIEPASVLRAAEAEAGAHGRSDWGPEQRRDRIAGRLAARRAVAELLGLPDLGGIAIANGERGEPVVCSHPSIALSLSHRDGRAMAIAALPGLAVGIDVERLTAIDDARARCFLTPRERDCGIERTQLWAFKEAAWKALACEPALPFTALELRTDARGHVTAAALNGYERRIECIGGMPWAGYVLGICLAASEVLA